MSTYWSLNTMKRRRKVTQVKVSIIFYQQCEGMIFNEFVSTVLFNLMKMCFNPTKISIVTFFIHSVPETPSFWCKPCTLQCSSQVDFDMHCSGKAHNKKVLSQAALGNGIGTIPSPINPINIVNISQTQQPLMNIESSAFR